MFFLIRMAFWFSLVLLVLPLGPAGESGPGVNPIQAFFAAKEAVDDMAGICERKPEVCEVGKAAMQTIGARARESARLAYEMLEESGTETPRAPEIEETDALIVSDDTAETPAKDINPTGSVSPANP